MELKVIDEACIACKHDTAAQRAHGTGSEAHIGFRHGGPCQHHRTCANATLLTCLVAAWTAAGWPDSGLCLMAGLSEEEGWSPHAKLRSEGIAEKGRARPSSPA